MSKLLDIALNLLLVLLVGIALGQCTATVAECQSCWHGTCYSSAQQRNQLQR